MVVLVLIMVLLVVVAAKRCIILPGFGGDIHIQVQYLLPLYCRFLAYSHCALERRGVSTTPAVTLL